MAERIMIAAASSGSGKTTWTCGLLELLLEQGRKPLSFKCGPDYIDPMFHRTVLGVPGRNLDSFFSDREQLRTALAEAGDAPCVLEGVMGIYDGIAGTAGQGSCYEIACMTGTPILLVMDAKGIGNTILSVVRGIIEDDEDSRIRGVVFNRMSAAYFEQIRPAAEKLLAEMGEKRGVPVGLIGHLPEAKGRSLGSRHLGLVMPREIPDLRESIRRTAEDIRRFCDLEMLGRIARDAEPIDLPAQGETPEAPDSACSFRADKAAVTETEVPATEAPVLAVARDEAFCFYYEENMEALRRAGIRTVSFSPLRDACLPSCDGLLLGGGYPELYAEELGANTAMRQSVREAFAEGLPVLAECGGFLYLQKELVTDKGIACPMAGVLPGKAYFAGRLQRFGYVSVSGGGLLEGLTIKGHEFHYYDTTENGEDGTAVKPGSGKSWKCLFLDGARCLGFPHLYYPSCPELAVRFREKMEDFRKHRKRPAE